jgi:RND family efflux transporter MFP subunit
MPRHLSFLLLLSLTVYLLSCSAKTEPVKKIESDRIPVRTSIINQFNNFSQISLSGQFTTDDEVMLSFKTGGIIDRIFVKEGDAIKKGQLLATLNLTEIDASMQQAQLAYEKAKRDYERLTNLYADSVATLEQLQNGKTALDLASQQLNSVRFNRNYSEIRAAANGFVLRKLASQGQQISAASAVLQTNGAGSGVWILRGGITDKQWAAVKAGDRAVIEAGSVSGQSLEGQVTRKSEAVDPLTGLFSIDITLIHNRLKSIAAGMFGSAVIKTGRDKLSIGPVAKTWAIPYDALLDGDGSTGYVFITNDNKTATRAKVVIAGIEKDQVIISQGLEDARAIIISGSAYLTDNSPIKIMQ